MFFQSFPLHFSLEFLTYNVNGRGNSSNGSGSDRDNGRGKDRFYASLLKPICQSLYIVFFRSFFFISTCGSSSGSGRGNGSGGSDSDSDTKSCKLDFIVENFCAKFLKLVLFLILETCF